MNRRPSFDELYSAALAVSIEGWDFAPLAGRYVLGSKPWSYHAIVRAAVAGRTAVVDLGTGGGEWFGDLALDNPLLIATECWRPNVAIAAARLQPMNISVLTHPAAPDNIEWMGTGGELPIKTASIDAVLSRHESYSPSEVARVLAPGGAFVTQQVGAAPLAELASALGAELTAPGWTREFAAAQLERSGLAVTDGASARVRAEFFDIGAVVYYARMVPWAFPGFDVHRDVDPLRVLHSAIEREAPFVTSYQRFWLRAERR